MSEPADITTTRENIVNMIDALHALERAALDYANARNILTRRALADTALAFVIAAGLLRTVKPPVPK